MIVLNLNSLLLPDDSKAVIRRRGIRCEESEFHGTKARKLESHFEYVEQVRPYVFLSFPRPYLS